MRLARKAGITFIRIWWAESAETGRSGFGNTRTEAIEYVVGFSLAGMPTVSPAWKCFYKDSPTIVAFGRSKVEALERLWRFQNATVQSASRA